MGNYDFSGLSASVRQIKPMLKRSRVRSQEDPEEWAGGSGPGSLCWPGSNAKGNKVGTCKTSSWQGLALAEGTTCGQPLPPALWWQDRARPRACGKAFPRSQVICHLSCLLLCLQEGAKEFAALHNPRSKCSGRRRRRHHVVSASCSNTPTVTETREGDSDRDTGNEWASSSSGMVPVLRQPAPLCVGSEGRQLLQLEFSQAPLHFLHSWRN